MNKFIVYTSNIGFVPRDMQQIIQFAQEKPKFYIANVELNRTLANVKPGDNIITKKGNSIYVIKTIQESMDEWSAKTQDYIDEIIRYGLKTANITSVEQIIKFETWCKTAKVFVKSVFDEKNNNEQNKEPKMGFKNLTESMMSKFMPREESNVRVSMDGNICVGTGEGFVSIDENNNLVSYPEEFTVALPVFTICKSQDQLVVGDIIALAKSFAKVTKIEGSKITAISYTGSGKTIHTIKDILFNQTMVRVVVSLTGSLGGQMNPMMMMAMLGSEKKGSFDKNALLAMMMMNQNGGNLGMNPMMMMMLSDGDSSLKDMLMLSAMSGNGFNMFGGMGMPQMPAQPTAAPAPKKPRAKKVKAEKVVKEEEKK